MPFVFVQPLTALVFLFASVAVGAASPPDAATAPAPSVSAAAPAGSAPQAKPSAKRKPPAKSSQASHPGGKASAAGNPKPVNGTYAGRADVRAFAEEFAQDSGIPRADVDRWLAAARFQPKIVELMDRPLLEPPKWFAYSPSFLSQARVEAGVQFWRANARTLARVRAPTHGTEVLWRAAEAELDRDRSCLRARRHVELLV